ncbi:MAG: FG-GAP-like repeat-containing protein [Planctomycetaceae bacterium]|nr:FG-GAP-like repeat-containing protein [Planctomycetaceae bacterium]
MRGLMLIAVVCGWATTGWAADLQFQLHAVDPEHTNSAAAAIDVDRDGRLDIVSGGWWYRAPDWKRTFVRDVEVIRGRFDDYSNLPLDVNGDGRLDYISANYRSSRIYWIEQPADPAAPWTTRLVAEPGRTETARLVDLNGDGRLDLLPNGTDFSAWWEIVPKNGGAEWVRHELPKELTGHGVGWGDVNGDGRGDLVCPKGWAEAPMDRVGGEWKWHPEFRLHRDGSVPMLVFDVDADGDADLVWSRAHHTGLFWLEQGRHGEKRTWTQHVIDTAWSQPHTLELADLDGDGRPEVVTGKRYMAHDGKDVGEWDPLVICAYSFLPTSKTWRRQVLVSGTDAGWDLDPKIVDLDADGDLDLVCPGRSGLYWLENVTNSIKDGLKGLREAAVDDLGIVAASYPDHRKIMNQQVGSELKPVLTPRDWGVRRSHLRANMQLVMGRLPDPSRRVPLDVQTVSEEQGDGYRRRKITFASEPGDRVPAWLLLPNGMTDKPQSMPAMLCLHQTTKLGKDEPANLGITSNRQYGHELAQRGYVCIVPDYPSFGEYEYDFKTKGSHYPSGSMKAIWNNLRAVDVLESIPQVDPDRMGVIGHSLGGHNAMFTAVFDLRLNAIVSSCGFTPFHDYYGGKVAGWTSDRYMPRIRDVYHNNADEIPFDFPEIVAALAPRAFFSNSPLHDANFDNDGVRRAFAEAKQVYDLLGAPAEKLRLETPDSAHDFPPEVRMPAYEWLEKQLK